MIPRSLRSTSRRFSRSCRPMRTRLRSSKRKSAAAFTSSTPWLAGREEGALAAGGGEGGLQPSQPRAPHSPPQSLLKRVSPSGSDISQPRDCGFLHDPGADSGGSSPLPGMSQAGVEAGGGQAQTLRCERWEGAPPRASGRVPASRLAPIAAQQQQHGQEHERGAGPVETGAAVTVVQEAASAHLLRTEGQQARE